MYGKIVIYCDMKVVTGLHIGASESFSAIGAVDSPVIRDPLTRNPIVPGSSLKGKLRTLLARSKCSDIEHMPDFDHDDTVILRMFGAADPVQRSRFQFSDCFVSNPELFSETSMTEVKTENGINRMTSVANPRQIERVIPGVKFGVRIVYDIVHEDEVAEDLETLAHAMKLLQLDYLGGHGSRGSGRVALENFHFDQVQSDISLEQLQSTFKKVENYGLLPV